MLTRVPTADVQKAHTEKFMILLVRELVFIRAPALRPYKGWAGAPLNWLPLPKDPFLARGKGEGNNL